MKTRIEKQISRMGTPVTVKSDAGVKNGRAVIYPVRNYQKPSDGIYHEAEGRSDSGRYMMFCERTLLKGVEYGATITCGEDEYMLIWADEYYLRMGGYVKSLLKKCAEKEMADW